jgi:hypothetical protein
MMKEATWIQAGGGATRSFGSDTFLRSFKPQTFAEGLELELVTAIIRAKENHRGCTRYPFCRE